MPSLPPPAPDAQPPHRIDPPNCGCTDCLTGWSRPARRDEWNAETDSPTGDPRAAAWDEGYTAGITDGDRLRHNPYRRQDERRNLAALLDDFEAEHGPVSEIAVRAALDAWIRCSECGQPYTVTRSGTRIHNNCSGRPWNRKEVNHG